MWAIVRIDWNVKVRAHGFSSQVNSCHLLQAGVQARCRMKLIQDPHTLLLCACARAWKKAAVCAPSLRPRRTNAIFIRSGPQSLELPAGAAGYFSPGVRAAQHDATRATERHPARRPLRERDNVGDTRSFLRMDSTVLGRRPRADSAEVHLSFTSIPPLPVNLRDLSVRQVSGTLCSSSLSGGRLCCVVDCIPTHAAGRRN